MKNNKRSTTLWIGGILGVLAIAIIVILASGLNKAPPQQGQDFGERAVSDKQQSQLQPKTPSTTPETTTTGITTIIGKTSSDGVDIIPDINYAECINKIKQTNPSISESNAKDNCLAVDAVNKGDSSLCNSILNSQIKKSCLSQF